MTYNEIKKGTDDDLGIPSVSDDDKKKKDAQFKMGLIVMVVAVIFIGYYAATSSDKEVEGDDLEAQVAEEYEINQRDLTIPVAPKQPRKKTKTDLKFGMPDLKPEKKKRSILQRPTSTPPLSLSKADSETADEKKARKKSKKMWEQRRAASPVVFDRKAKQDAETIKRSQRHVLDIDKITSDLMSKVGSAAQGAKFGGGGRDKMAQRLQSAKTTGITASYLAEKPYTIAEGKMLSCILETAIHSALPGMTRCILAENIFSYDGNQLLLEKGSRLVGQYEGGIQAGEDRIFVIWTRILTPGGVDIALDSPGTGELGRAGHGVYIDSHFFERFGASALLSIVGGLAASESDGNVQLRAVGDSFNKSAEIALRESIKIRPTGHKNQGERIKVFVARDIDFAPVLQLARNKVGR